MNDELSVVLVTYNSDKQTLSNCIKNINNNIKIIIVDNSSILKPVDFEKQSNKEISIIHSENHGNGEGINIGVKHSSTKYVLYLDVDTEIDEGFIENIYEYAKKIKKFAILAPKQDSLSYTYRNQDIINEYKEYLEMRFVPGSIMLINVDNTYKNNIRFDKNIFLYWEESDFFFQCLKKGEKIYLLKNLNAKHFGDSSIEKKYSDEINLNRNWHYMWSKFYYFKKNYGYIRAYRETLKQFISSLFRYLIYTILKNNKNKIYKERLSGLYNSYLGYPSSRRPNISNENYK